jgi:LysR family transcriptional regulator, hydrogen peroxide-inducible genes activator
MTLIQLKYAVTLDKVRNFASAAHELLIAQPTLSLQIQKLEKYIGIILFDRTKNPISTTVEGAEFLKQAKIVLQEAERLEFMYSQKGDAVSGELRVGIIPTVSSSLLIKIIPVMFNKYPDLKIKLFELPTYQIIQKIESNELDIGILATPLGNKKLKEEHLYYEPFCVYLSPSIQIEEDPVSIDQIQNYDMIILGEEHCFRGQALKVCKNNSLGRIEAGSFETVKKLVDGDLGITLLPEFEDVKEPRRKRTLKMPIPAREISIVTSFSFYKTKMLRALKNEILNIIPRAYHSKNGYLVIGVD